MNPLLKFLLLSLCGLILTALPIQAEEKSWYSIDGIKFRYGTSINRIEFKVGNTIGTQGYTVFETIDSFSHLKGRVNLPIAIALPETLMTSWSFRGALFEYQPKMERKDLVPSGGNPEILNTTTQLRQPLSDRTSLYNDFFNASDKAFADANSNWALSADVTSSQVFLGYYLGVFIPIGEYQRILKLGAGLGVFYTDLSYKLNLCSQYKVVPDVGTQGWRASHGGECVGKTEIDYASSKGFGVATILHYTFWERVTKDSIWKIVSTGAGMNLTKIGGNLKNHHDKNLNVILESSAPDSISYTYRF
jgi:hypothetical protein